MENVELYIESVNKARLKLIEKGNSFTLMELHQMLLRYDVPIGRLPIASAMREMGIVKIHVQGRYMFGNAPIFKLKFSNAYKLAQKIQKDKRDKKHNI